MLKKTIIISTVVALLSVSAMARGNQGKNSNNNRSSARSTSQGINFDSYLANYPLATLTNSQKENLIFMLEEEKLARDSYLALYEKWNLRTFSQIAQAEQQHVDAMLALADRYNLQVPLSFPSQGQFENEELQELYDNLTAKGSLSLVDALEVGVAIEETDINDFETMVNNDTPDDLKLIYTNLLQRSYTHLNAFNNRLSQQ